MACGGWTTAMLKNGKTFMEITDAYMIGNAKEQEFAKCMPVSNMDIVLVILIVQAAQNIMIRKISTEEWNGIKRLALMSKLFIIKINCHKIKKKLIGIIKGHTK